MGMDTLIAGTCFVLENMILSYVIDTCFYTADYEEKMDRRYVQSMQKYINENEITIRDCSKLKKWAKKQHIMSVVIYQDRKKIFDSDYLNHDFWMDEIEEVEYGWVTYYEIQFKDGSAKAGILRRYQYQLYNYAFFFEIVSSFVLFIILVLIGVRKKIEYIQLLINEIAILENGGLEYKITVRGNDELMNLADGLNKMRISFINMMEREAMLVNENQWVITEMSHDLRTPVTSIILLLEVIKKENYQNEKLMKEYLEKIEKKTLQMKQLTDHLFKYSLVNKKIICEKMTFEECFFDP